MDLIGDERIEMLQDECLRLRSEGWSLRELKDWLENVHHEVKGTNTITEWVKEASIRKFTAEGHADFKMQKVMGMAELEEVQRDLKKLLNEKKITVTLKNAKGEEYEKEIPFTGMTIATMMKTLIDVIDRKNDIRGLNSKAIQLQLNQYNNDIHVSDEELSQELGDANPDLLTRLRDILKESNEVVEVDGSIIEDESTEATGESSSIHEDSTE